MTEEFAIPLPCQVYNLIGFYSRRLKFLKTCATYIAVLSKKRYTVIAVRILSVVQVGQSPAQADKGCRPCQLLFCLLKYYTIYGIIPKGKNSTDIAFHCRYFLYDIILFIRRFYMPTSEARKRACKKYEQEKIDRIPLRVPRGKKAQIQERAASLNESINAYINRLINEDLAKPDT